MIAIQKYTQELIAPKLPIKPKTVYSSMASTTGIKYAIVFTTYYLNKLKSVTCFYEHPPKREGAFCYCLRSTEEGMFSWVRYFITVRRTTS